MAEPKASRREHVSQLRKREQLKRAAAAAAGEALPAAPAAAVQPPQADLPSVVPEARPGRRPPQPAVTAQALALRQREISVSEFFTKNRHLLGFDNPGRALLATVKEAVDNSLDACQEAHLLPEIQVEIRQIEETRFRVIVQDNGPGIVRQQIPKIFGKLLYGSKFHTLKQSRGQQGIGISAAGMYGQLTTGKPVAISSCSRPGKPAHYYEIQLDTERNQPIVLKEAEVEWQGKGCGTRVEIELEGRYQKGRHSIDTYLQQTALANPHVEIRYTAPKGDPMHFPRVVEVLPPDPREIRPHPYGVELGILQGMLKASKGQRLASFLSQAFSRVSRRTALEISARAELKPEAKVHLLTAEEAERLFRAIGRTKLMAPPTDCLSPIGENVILKSLREQIRADFYTAKSRSPVVYRGNPFLVEAGIAYGGELAADEPIALHRFANRVPLLFQQSACAMTDAALSIDWKGYGLAQSRGALPVGPAVLLVHVASVWVPFTSESKEAVADYEEIVREIRLALQECGRQLGRFVQRRRRDAEAERKRTYIERYIPYIGEALQEILELGDGQRSRLEENLKSMLERSRS
ncbi:MAG: DNA topoisomerase VI subunit B [bacterium]